MMTLKTMSRPIRGLAAMDRLRMGTWALLMVMAHGAGAADLRLLRGHSELLEFRRPIATVAVGDPEVADALAVTPERILVNGKRAGATSLTAVGNDGDVHRYQILVEHDLGVLQQHLRELDRRIRVVSDPNGDAVMLLGTVANRHVIGRAVEATVRFLGSSNIQFSRAPRSIEQDALGLGLARDAEAGGESVAGVRAAEAVLTETVSSGNTRVVNLLVSEQEQRPAPERLEGLLRQLDERIGVSLVNDVFVLKGVVDTPSQLVRALVLADRFVGGTGDFSFTVVADRGGVLAGNLTETDIPELVLDDGIAVPDIRVFTPGIGGQRSVSQRGGGTRTITLPSRVSDPKGNLGQNLARADVITLAEGRVVSMIKVAERPRIEVQLHIVSVDRNRARDMGINWQIVGENITLLNVTGNIGAAANLLASYVSDDGSLSIEALIRALEDNGAGKTLAEPTLSTVSGEAASFLVGGNIPISQGSTTVTTVTGTEVFTNPPVFIEFGLRLVVRPTLLEDGRIGIVLDQEIIDPDNQRGIVLDGSLIPAFTQRTVRTVTESRDGETWAVAGLLSKEDLKRLREVPLLSRIPVLGNLFKLETTREQHNELIITVTARRIAEGYFGAESRQARIPAMTGIGVPAPTGSPSPVITAPADPRVPATAVPGQPGAATAPAGGSRPPSQEPAGSRYTPFTSPYRR